MRNSSSGFVGLLRTIHGWLGFFVLPWIIAIGLTGLYMNHSSLVLGMLPNQNFNEAVIDKWPSPMAVDETGAREIAKRVFGAGTFRLRTTDSYHNRDVWRFQNDDYEEVIVVKANGYYWVKQGYTRITFDPDGRQVDYKYYYGDLFKSIHASGWYDSRLGTWLADIAAGAMVVFGLSGLILFVSSKLGRRRAPSGPVIAAPAAQVASRGTPRPRRIKLE